MRLFAISHTQSSGYGKVGGSAKGRKVRGGAFFGVAVGATLLGIVVLFILLGTIIAEGGGALFRRLPPILRQRTFAIRRPVGYQGRPFGHHLDDGLHGTLLIPHRGGRGNLPGRVRPTPLADPIDPDQHHQSGRSAFHRLWYSGPDAIRSSAGARP